MTQDNDTGACCASGTCASGDCARSSGWPLLVFAAILAGVWAFTGNSGWLMLAGLTAAAGAIWWLAAKWANGKSGAC